MTQLDNYQLTHVSNVHVMSNFFHKTRKTSNQMYLIITKLGQKQAFNAWYSRTLRIGSANSKRLKGILRESTENGDSSVREKDSNSAARSFCAGSRNYAWEKHSVHPRELLRTRPEQRNRGEEVLRVTTAGTKSWQIDCTIYLHKLIFKI